MDSFRSTMRIICLFSFNKELVYRIRSSIDFFLGVVYVLGVFGVSAIVGMLQ